MKCARRALHFNRDEVLISVKFGASAANGPGSVIRRPAA